MTDILFLAEILVAVLLIIGAAFTLIGSYGLLKLDQPMKRLHAPTKASTLGVGSLLLAAMIHAFATGDGSLHEMLVMAFLFVTAPISGNFIAKVHLHRQRGGAELPAPPEEETWATYAEK
ncbi:multicomponent K+:H+ antiporter subunit G [Limimaricola variabilis]|jgi:multicomponent K+:H+ antiporter subunit G|uniref:Multicomponent K+:H+ antiporter subunit G n=1 Tax=Limimaricola variabilis TaxID=1492771 RepID=A0ABR6HKF5_9RHOB|nr:Na+/H+ antiporter subunit G [Limimaricola variabilis]MBB3711030.1 multicomponent K+:H+ antiporter subunit G [Limimaricola variabilis]WPY95578.1 Na+/H+ antiporter subunit G [Limimaricola variabilis]